MIRIGDYNELKALRSTSVGVFFTDEEGTEILLPNKYVPSDLKLNQSLQLFCYLDHEERPVATTLKPYITRDDFAFLRVVDVNNIGAFLDWGLEKHLFVPFREQVNSMEKGKSYLVYCYLDEKTFRLAATAKLSRFLEKPLPTTYKANEQVSLIISRKTQLGWEVIVDKKFLGLLFFDDVFQPLTVGKALPGFIKKVREDGKLDITLQPTGKKMLDQASEKIYNYIVDSGGFIPLHDKSGSGEIKAQLQMSKKSFKRGVGILYKQKKIELLPNGITLKT